MRTELEQIKIIENYLLGKMNETEKRLFEKQINDDPQLKETVFLQKGVMEAVSELCFFAKAENAHNRYLKGLNQSWYKNWKLWGYLGSGLVALLVITYFTIITTKSHSEVTAYQNHFKNDSVSGFTEDYTISNGVEEEHYSYPVIRNKGMYKGTLNGGLREVLLYNDSNITSVFQLNPSKDTMLVSKSGNLIYVPKNSFRDEEGRIIESEVALSVTEYTTLSNIILNNLNTLASNEKLLETGGMFYLKATEGNRNLSLNNRIGIGITSSNDLSEMKEFYLNEEFNCWELDSVHQIFSSEMRSCYETKPGINEIPYYASHPACVDIPIKCDLRYFDVEQLIINNACEYLDKKDFDSTMFTEKQKMIFKVKTNGEVYTGKNKFVGKRLSAKFTPAIKKGIPVDAIGEVNYLIRDTNFSRIDVRSSFRWDTLCNSIFFSEQLPTLQEYEDYLNMKEVVRQKYKENLASMAARNKERRIRESEIHWILPKKLKWINCDRFVLTKNQELCTQNGVSYSSNVELKEYLIFKKIKSIYSSRLENNKGTNIFTNVPRGKLAILLSVGIEPSDSLFYFAKKEIRIGEELYPQVDIQKMNKTTFIDALNELDIELPAWGENGRMIN